jgi:hypothetical protein
MPFAMPESALATEAVSRGAAEPDAMLPLPLPDAEMAALAAQRRDARGGKA